MYQNQFNLFYNLELLIQHSKFHKKYDLIFQALDLSNIKNLNFSIGCSGHSQHAIIRAFIVKSLERIDSVPKLIDFLDAHPALAQMCGFYKTIPDSSTFYRFLKNFKHSDLEKLFYSINKKLIAKNIISTKHFLIDSKPIMAATKNNNFKNPKRNTYNKHKKCKRNPQATLSYYSYQSVHGKKDNFIFFWGYRTHVIVSKEGIPLIEITLSNSQTDAKVAKKIIKKLKRVYGIKKNSIFIADSAYDQRELYNFINNKMKAKAFFPINKRATKLPKTLDKNGIPICEAKLSMKSAGIWQENLRTRAKFRCPLKASKKIAKQFPEGCPSKNSTFSSGNCYGCTKYLDITDDPRAHVPRDTDFFKTTYALRTEVERYFARLGDREAEKTKHYNLRSVKNQMTIAHLSLSLVAYAAAILLKRPDKIRSYRTFAYPENLNLQKLKFAV